jgi:unsaturated rhamnogalacturonyl hydrolase
MKSNFIIRMLLLMHFIISLSLQSFSQKIKDDYDLSYWIEGCSPIEVGKRVAELYAISLYYNHLRPTLPKSIVYPEVCTWYGALTFAKLSGDKHLIQRLIDRFESLLNENSSLIPVPDHVDFTVFGVIPLELYILTQNFEYLEMGKKFADQQWELSKGSNISPEAEFFYEKGYTPQTRMWIDDMYMISAVQVQAYRATGELKYIERTAKQMVLYLDSLQQPNGLFFHAPDVPFFWGRGNGWMAAGMTELLISLPENNSYRPKIMKCYKKMMASLLRYQTENGTWRQLIDDPNSWPETSCTGMFTFALLSGVKYGWLDKNTYGEVARRAWLGLISYINEKGEIQEVCEGTGKKNDRQYYLNRKHNVGDLHGQAPILWCVSALLK